MSEDQQTYQRAVSVALIGLAVQFVFILTALALAIWIGTPGMSSLMFHAIGGLLIWLSLAIVYDQHRRERIEALESEEIASRSGRDNSIFENALDDLSVARRRLDRMYRWLLPIISGLTSLLLIGIGLWRLSNWTSLHTEITNYSSLDDQVASPLQQITPDQHTAMVVLFLSLLLIFAGFIFSRYVAGMSKVKAWTLLRGGAGYLMGCLLMLLLLGIGLVGVWMEKPYLLLYVGAVIPVISIVIGIEVALNLLLDFYRPRRAGEIPRPAFDSRLLSLLTSPESIASTINEAINYQFGFEITHSWFWQLLSRAFTGLIVFAVLVLIGISSIVIVEPHEQVVITRAGDIKGEPLGPGLHFKLPWPISSAHRYDVQRLRTISVGSHIAENLSEDEPILWTNWHAGQTEQYLLLAPPKDAALRTGERSSDQPESTSAMNDEGDTSLLAGLEETDAPPVPSRQLAGIEVFASYYISDLLAYLKNYDQPEQVFRKTIEEVTTEYFLRYDIDELVGASRETAAKELTALMQSAINDKALGMTITWVGVAGVHPAQSVAPDFEALIASRHEREERVEQGLREAIMILSQAAGSRTYARRIIREMNALDAMRAASDIGLQERFDQFRRLLVEQASPEVASETISQLIARVEQMLERTEVTPDWNEQTQEIMLATVRLVEPGSREETLHRIRELIAVKQARIDPAAVSAQEAEVIAMVLEAGGKAAQTIARARAYRWEVENAEAGRAARFESERRLYEAAPEVYRISRYFEALIAGIGEARTFLIAADRDRIMIRGNFTSSESMLPSADLTVRPDER